MYFPIDGMYGGFSYWFELKNDELELISESWSRIWWVRPKYFKHVHCWRRVWCR
jgi:hypothetical protein